jgi:hypothetical protein
MTSMRKVFSILLLGLGLGLMMIVGILSSPPFRVMIGAILVMGLLFGVFGKRRPVESSGEARPFSVLDLFRLVAAAAVAFGAMRYIIQWSDESREADRSHLEGPP